MVLKTKKQYIYLDLPINTNTTDAKEYKTLNIKATVSN